MGQTSISTWLTSKPTPGPRNETNVAQANVAYTEATPLDDQKQVPPLLDVQQTQSRTSTTEARATEQPKPTVAPSTIGNRPHKGLNARASIEPCSEGQIKAFRRLTSLLLPIPYPDSFYKETIADPVVADLSRVVSWREVASQSTQDHGHQMDDRDEKQMVAAIRCRLLANAPNQPATGSPILYVSTLATLSAFRDKGLASALLQDVTTRAAQDYGANAIMAHVWEANDEALAWYKRRQFRVVDKDELYYRRLAPKTAAFVIRRDLKPSDLVAMASESSKEGPTMAET